jgi:hypothetical protein
LTTGVLDNEVGSTTLRLYGLLVIDGSVITKNTSNDAFAQRFRTKHSLLIFGVQETLYYLNVASKNRLQHFRRLVLGSLVNKIGPRGGGRI